jgi:acetoin utilization deacetylase AcuC-like enzyme
MLFGQVFVLMLLAAVNRALRSDMISLKRLSTRLLSSKRISLFYNDIYEQPLPAGHRFPMEKYRKVRQTLQRELAHDGVGFHESPLVTEEELATTHCRGYINRFLTGSNMTELEIRKIGFPWSKEGTYRALSSVGGTLAATRAVCSEQVVASGHIAGGTHHAFYDRGEGFCVFSDIAVAANVALKEFGSKVKKVLIIDLDVHQGNGNAKLFEDNDAVFTFSMHCSGNYFSQKQESDWDVEIAPNTGDEEYLQTLSSLLPSLFADVQPDLVFFQAGVDVFGGDRLGKLSLSRQGLQRRNLLVYTAAKASGARVVTTMGGGYPRSDDPGSDNYKEVLECHADCYRQLVAVYSATTA